LMLYTNIFIGTTFIVSLDEKLLRKIIN